MLNIYCNSLMVLQKSLQFRLSKFNAAYLPSFFDITKICVFNNLQPEKDTKYQRKFIRSPTSNVIKIQKTVIFIENCKTPV